jgi:tRNA G18 (ribose-2'-O)-methylase SpoU
VITSNTKAIAKTALGAEAHIVTTHAADAVTAIKSLKPGTHVVALEQAPGSIDYFNYKAPPGDLCLVVGSEVDGLAEETIAACEAAIEIPQRGHKESLNVSVAAGIALYALSGVPEEPTDV